MEPKTVGGVVILGGAGAGSGYAISSAIDSNDQTGAPNSTGKTKPQNIKVSKKLEESKFSLLKLEKVTKDDGDYTKWKAILKAHHTGSGTFEENKDYSSEITAKQQQCKTWLAEDYSLEKLTNVIKNCVESVSFLSRAKSLNISIMEDDSAPTWETRLTTVKANLKSISDSSRRTPGKTISATPTKDELKVFCTDVGQLKWESFKSSDNGKNNLETEWKNYLTTCAREATTNKDFWTGTANS